MLACVTRLFPTVWFLSTEMELALVESVGLDAALMVVRNESRVCGMMRIASPGMPSPSVVKVYQASAPLFSTNSGLVSPGASWNTVGRPVPSSTRKRPLPVKLRLPSSMALGGSEARAALP